MKQFLRLTLVLAFVSFLAAAALALTYRATKDSIAEKERMSKAQALEDIFFQHKPFFPRPVEGVKGVTAIYASETDKNPLFYAAEGRGVGYNTGVPITLLVGFTHPGGDAPALLKGYADASKSHYPSAGKKGLYIVGWKVVKSEETPGLGEKAKESRARNTWVGRLTGSAGDTGNDLRTAFQKQFSGYQASDLKVKPDGGQIDIITAATISSRGIVYAIADAEARLQKALAASP